MKKLSLVLNFSALVLLTACGESTTENVTNINQMGMEVVSDVSELPKCTKDNEGEMAFVKGETSPRICIDKKWFATKDAVRDSASDFSCTTKQLKDKSGVKIICNGDSIGVVYNGKDGSDGKDGKDGEPGTAGKSGIDGKDGADGLGCTLSQKDSVITITCGEKTAKIDLGSGIAIVDTTVLDSEKIAVSLDSLAGYSQKGPFLNGSTVYLYELEDGRTLKQTNGNFTSNIKRDDGYYKFSARDLVSQYALIVVDGHYRNEVTGENSNSAIKLKAISDVHKHSTGANVNILTHLEYERVYYLVTKKKLKVSAAKRQAQREIFNQFHIVLDDYTDAEAMDVFGSTEADAALLALSILLQGDRSEAEMTALLTEISNNMAEDGSWDGVKVKAEIADSALSKDDQNKLATYRSNVKGWGLSATVPEFEKYIRRFASIEDSLGVCGVDEKVGTVKQVKNVNSKKYYAKSYTDTSSSVSGKTRFICIDSTGVGKMWRVATDLEKDRFNWNPKNTKDGALLGGPVSGRKLVWDSDTLRHADNSEVNDGKGCTSYNRNELKILDKDANGTKQYSFYRCTEDGWTFTLDTLNRGTVDYAGQTYKTIGIKTQMWMAENLNYEVDNSYCYNNSADSCAKYGRLYTWIAAIDSVKLATDEDNPLVCGYGKLCGLTGTVRGICPEGWHIPTSDEWNTLYSVIGSSLNTMLEAKDWESVSKDVYGFSALPAGSYYCGRFGDVGSVTYFWSATESRNAVYVSLMNAAGARVEGGHYGTNFAISVRCVKD